MNIKVAAFTVSEKYINTFPSRHHHSYIKHLWVVEQFYFFVIFLNWNLKNNVLPVASAREKIVQYPMYTVYLG